jgi:hypothetical protein
MMGLEKQVVSLELARKLKALGIVQESLLALVGFQGRGFADGVQPDFCPSLLLEALIYQ